MRGEPVEPKNLMQTSAKFCEVFAFKISFFPLSAELHHLTCRSCKYFYHLPPHHVFTVLPFWERKQVQTTLLHSPGSWG